MPSIQLASKQAVAHLAASGGEMLGSSTACRPSKMPLLGLLAESEAVVSLLASVAAIACR